MYGQAAIEASSDYNKLVCPLSFNDGGHVPWVVEFKVRTEVCKHTAWTERNTFEAALADALVYFNNALAITSIVLIFIIKKTGLLTPVELRPCS